MNLTIENASKVIEYATNPDTLNKLHIGYFNASDLNKSLIHPYLAVVQNRPLDMLLWLIVSFAIFWLIIVIILWMRLAIKRKWIDIQDDVNGEQNGRTKTTTSKSKGKDSFSTDESTSSGKRRTKPNKSR